MTSYVKLILKILEIIQDYFDKLAKDKFNEDKKDIDADPVDAFNERYGVSDNKPEEMLSSDAQQPEGEMEPGENGSNIK